MLRQFFQGGSGPGRPAKRTQREDRPDTLIRLPRDSYRGVKGDRLPTLYTGQRSAQCGRPLMFRAGRAICGRTPFETAEKFRRWSPGSRIARIEISLGAMRKALPGTAPRTVYVVRPIHVRKPFKKKKKAGGSPPRRPCRPARRACSDQPFEDGGSFLFCAKRTNDVRGPRASRLLKI